MIDAVAFIWFLGLELEADVFAQRTGGWRMADGGWDAVDAKEEATSSGLPDTVHVKCQSDVVCPLRAFSLCGTPALFFFIFYRSFRRDWDSFTCSLREFLPAWPTALGHLPSD